MSPFKPSMLQPTTTINCRGQLVDLSIPRVMGIVNLTPDSFYENSRNQHVDAVLEVVDQMLEDGATFIDIGGQSTRPGALPISNDNEWTRIESVLLAIKKAFPNAIISVDTMSATVAKRSLDSGADIINDISAGRVDEAMLATVAAYSHVPYIIMHMQGMPTNMQVNPRYDNLMLEITDFLIERLEAARDAKIKDVILDPGFGFGKTVEQNYTLLKRLSDFQIMELPILVGLSRKSMIQKVLNIEPKAALNGTTVLNTMALSHGAKILRVHDVKEAMETIQLMEQLKCAQFE